MPRSACGPFLGHPARTENGCVYYHVFQVQGTIFGPLRYCRFAYAGVNYFGKIHSCWQAPNEPPMAEVQPFRYRKSGRTFSQDECGAYREVVAVVGDCLEIPISSILPDSALMCWVPPDVSEADLFDYVESNMGKPEYPDEDDTDDTDDDEDDCFIVDGDVFGWYQYATDGPADKEWLAPPPQFIDMWMTYEPPQAGQPWYRQQFPHHIFNEYFKDRFVPLAARSSETMALFAKVDNGTAPKFACPIKASELHACSVFVADLKRGLNGESDAHELYKLCLEFKNKANPRSAKNDR